MGQRGVGRYKYGWQNLLEQCPCNVPQFWKILGAVLIRVNEPMNNVLGGAEHSFIFEVGIPHQLRQVRIQRPSVNLSHDLCNTIVENASPT